DYIKKVSIPYPAWILFLGPDFLKKYGEKKLLKTPALIAEKVGNGVFIVLKYYGMGTEADQRKAEKEKDYEVEAGKYLTELFKIE
ncbi:MAG: hypothetical protein HZB66_01345, partial [Candidatus Aenigmarchaeota archaeon]|nr:hypothetical protein [Candidatus Aenigmarchaeota archaeon]